MKNNKINNAKTLVKVGGILLIVFGAIALFLTTLILIGLTGSFSIATEYEMQEISKIFMPGILSLFIFMFLLILIASIVVGIICLKFSSLNDVAFIKKRTFFLVFGIIFLFSQPTFISGILLIIAYAITYNFEIINKNYHNRNNTNYIDANSLMLANTINNWFLSNEQSSMAPVMNALYLAYKHNIVVFNVDHKQRTNNLNNEYVIPIYLAQGDIINDNKSIKEQSMRELLNDLPDNNNFKGYLIHTNQHKLLIDTTTITTIIDFIPESSINVVKTKLTNLNVDMMIKFKQTNNSYQSGPIEVNIHKNKIGRQTQYTLEIDLPALIDDEDNKLILKKYLFAALNTAHKYNCSLVSLETIPIGIGNFTIYELANLTIDAFNEWINKHPDSIINIYLSNEDIEIYRIYREYIEE